MVGRETFASVLNRNRPLARRAQTRTRDLEVIDALVEMIEAENLTVGDRLPPEQELARRLNVGRSTIREALKAWQGMGIVFRNKGAGTVLAAEVASNAIHLPLTLKLEAESLLRTHAVRRPLEIEATWLAAQNASDEDRKRISARDKELQAVFELGEDWREADARFHTAIHQACGNPLFHQLIEQLQGAFHDIYEAPLGEPRLGENTIPLHHDLAMAVIEGRADDAAALIEEIMVAVDSEVKKAIDVDGR